MRTGPAHNSYLKARPSTAERVLEGVETAGKFYSTAQTAYGLARGGLVLATRVAPLLGLL